MRNNFCEEENLQVNLITSLVSLLHVYSLRIEDCIFKMVVITTSVCGICFFFTLLWYFRDLLEFHEPGLTSKLENMTSTYPNE